MIGNFLNAQELFFFRPLPKCVQNVHFFVKFLLLQVRMILLLYTLAYAPERLI